MFIGLGFVLLSAAALWPDSAPARAGPTPVDFSISSDPDLGAKALCDSSSTPTATCEMPLGATFKVSINLNTLPSNLDSAGYGGYQAGLQYSGVANSGAVSSLDFSPWPGCALEFSSFIPGEVQAGCVLATGNPGSSYTGRLHTVAFTCTQDGTIAQVNGASSTTIVDGTNTTFSESGPNESLTIDCVDEVEFAMRVEPAFDVLGVCDSSGWPTQVCTIRNGATFNVLVLLEQFSTSLDDGYEGFSTQLDYTGITSAQTPQSVDLSLWPDCVGGGSGFGASGVEVHCYTSSDGGHGPTSMYLGTMATVEFTCAASGTLSMPHGESDTYLFDAPIFFEIDPDGTESLTINCVDPAPYPADTDGDGCPDTRESQTPVGSQLSGGKRDFLNPNDYFNPSHDGQNRVDDILLVVGRYFKDDLDGNPGQPPYYTGGSPAYTYNPDMDRTDDPGSSEAWNLLGPNGQQRVDDILNMVKQYFHDCA